MNWKGSTEQSVLHFKEQFRQLDEVSPPNEILPFTTRLTILQTAVHAIPELRIVETMEEFLSLTSFSTDSTIMTATLPSFIMLASGMIKASNRSLLLLPELHINIPHCCNTLPVLSPLLYTLKGSSTMINRLGRKSKKWFNNRTK